MVILSRITARNEMKNAMTLLGGGGISKLHYLPDR